MLHTDNNKTDLEKKHQNMLYTEQIIELVRKHPVLYDTSHPNYKNLRRKDQIWEEISQELDADVGELKKKWKNIRDSYAKYLRNLKNEPSGRNYKNWKWAPEMNFLRPYFQSDLNEVSINWNDNDSDKQFSGMETTEADQKFHTESTFVESPSIVINENAEISIKNSHSLAKTYDQHKKRKYDNDSEDRKSITFVDTSTIYDQSQQTPLNMDAVELIFLGYAKTIKSFSPKRQAIAKLKIAKIIMEQELKHLNEIEPSSENFRRSPTRSRSNSSS